MKAPASNIYSALSEEKLWLAFKKGNSEAFAEMYSRYVQALYNYGYKITSDRKLIEDSIQELFIYLWKTREKLSDTDSIKFYLFRSLRREITRKLSQNPMGHEPLEDAENLESFASVFSHESYLIQEQTEIEKVQALQKALDTLTRRQREVITLRFYDGFSYEEIGEIMSLNYKSVCNLIYKALDLLKKNIVLLLCWVFSYPGVS